MEYYDHMLPHALTSIPPLQVSLIQPGPIRTPIWSKGFESSNQIVDNMGPEADRLYGTLMEKV